MHNLSKTSKILLLLAALSGSLWMGAYFARLIVFYQLFEPKELILRPVFNEQNLHAVLIELNPLIILTLVLYMVFIITYFVFITISKISLKDNGWLFIVTVIIFITLPFELYLVSFDYRIISSVLTGNFNSTEIIQLIIQRFKVLSSFPVIELFCYFSIVYFVLFKPLTKKNPAYEN
ncbi:MAG: hypothetical protein WCE54_18915 [Ignavibacteriaceae bacterium]